MNWTYFLFLMCLWVIFFICGAVWLVYVCYDIQSVLHGILCILMGQFERAAFSKKVRYGYKEMSEVSITICNYHTFNHKKQQHAHLLKMSRLVYIQTANWMKCHAVSLYDVACIDLSGVADWCCKLWLCCMYRYGLKNSTIAQTDMVMRLFWAIYASCSF